MFGNMFKHSTLVEDSSCLKVFLFAELNDARDPAKIRTWVL